MRPRLGGKVIEGRHHPIIKMVRGMVRSGELWADGQVLLETPHLIEEALASGVMISRVLVSRDAASSVRDLLKKFPAKTPIDQIAPSLFQALTTTESSPGVLALAHAPAWREEDLFSSPPSLVLVLAGLQDPGNLGTILRTAEAFGATGVLLTRGTVSPFNAKAIRAAAGALFRLPLLRGLSPWQVISLLRRKQMPLFAGVAKGGKSLQEIDVAGAAALALGSEGAGLLPELEEAGVRVSIPMGGKVESLNVATAATVLLYEIARQRQTAAGAHRRDRPPPTRSPRRA